MRPLAAAVVAVGLCSGCVIAPPPPPPLPARGVAVTFDDALSPHGRWVVIANMGRAWRPYVHVVGADFVPYFSGGRWEHTRHGWVFETDWPFGWAVFHYGRWYFDPLEGWVWVPGDVWGPSWVEWRSGGGYVGWVPLPPPGIELVVRVYRPRWCFVAVHHFTHHEVWLHRVDEEVVFHSATAVPRVQAPDPAWVAREGGTPVRTVDIGPRPAPGHIAPMPRIERQRPEGVAAPPAELERKLRPEPPGAAPQPPPPSVVAPPPAPRQRFERPADRRPEAMPSAPAPPARRFERPPDRRPEPAQPQRFEAPPPRRQQPFVPPPAPAPAPAPVPPRRQDKKPPLAT